MISVFKLEVISVAIETKGVEQEQKQQQQQQKLNLLKNCIKCSAGLEHISFHDNLVMTSNDSWV